jgi:L-iditol 2-dehydrogenase
MKAARFIEPERIDICEAPEPECGAGDIVVEVHRAGICGTDLRIFRGRKEVSPPVTLGHEFSGTIAEVGPEVDGLSKGDRVTVEPIIPCGNCYCCNSGRENICLTRPTIGYQYDGGFAEYVRIPEDAVRIGNVIPFSDNLGFDEACFAEPLAACINGSKKYSLGSGERVWIVGDGPIGLTHLQLACARGVEEIYLTGTRDERLSEGSRLGAGATHNVSGGVSGVEWIQDQTRGEGVDVAIIATNVIVTVSEAVASLRKGGRMLLFAGYPSGTMFPFDLSHIHYMEYEILGASGHAARDVRKAVELMSEGKFDASPLITHHMPLESIHEGLEMKENFIGLKHLIDLK